MRSILERATGTMGRVLTRLGVALSHPAAFLVALLYLLVWAVLQPESLDLHGLVAMAALFMTLFIQRAAHRDTQALHAKLDELIRVEKGARNELVALDEQEPELIEKHRHQENAARDLANKHPAS